MTKKAPYHQELRELADTYVHFIYRCTKSFPDEEKYGVTSQLRRSALSVILNYIEGYARNGKPSYKHFLTIAYGSLKESEYLIEFSMVEKYISPEDGRKGKELADRVGAMLWGIIKELQE